MALVVYGLPRLRRAIYGLTLDLRDMPVFVDLARSAAKVITHYVPRRSGALAASVRVRVLRNTALVLAGGGRVTYAGVVNYGSRKAGTAGQHFMQRADPMLRRTAPAVLEQALNRHIATRGL